MRAAMSVRLAGGGAEITPLVVLAVDSALGAALGAQTGRLQLLAPLAWGLAGRENRCFAGIFAWSTVQAPRQQTRRSLQPARPEDPG